MSNVIPFPRYLVRPWHPSHATPEQCAMAWQHLQKEQRLKKERADRRAWKKRKAV